MASYFVIGVGGTGMRCLEAFTHLCALGLCDSHDIHLLSIETDFQNGNKNRTDGLISLYQEIRKGNDGKQLKPSSDTFFSAQLHYYRFATQYTQSKADATYLQKMDVSPIGQTDDFRLSNLLFPKNVHNLDLSHGYRGQTHLGSLLMYHEMLREAEKQDSELQKFVEKLQATPNARVFVTGSVFGGTGASSIPLVPKILEQVAKKLDANKILKVHYGGVLLTNYFSFGQNKQQTEEEKVVASSSNFPLNSQTALTFYHNDETVEKTYSAMYHIGWPLDPVNYQPPSSSKVLTGGAEQQNPAHPLELITAFAALDFFMQSELNGHEKYFTASKQTKGGQAFFDFATLAVNPALGKQLEKKLGAMLAFAMLLNSKDINGKMAALLTNLKSRTKNALIESIKKEDLSPLEAYLQQFWYSNKSGTIHKGWFWQLKDQVGYDDFLFNAACFDENQVEVLNWGGIYQDNSYNFPLGKSLTNFFKKPNHKDAFDYFTTKALVDIGIPETISTNSQAFIKYFHDGLMKAFQVP
jgi:hypothetical protein